MYLMLGGQLDCLNFELSASLGLFFSRCFCCARLVIVWYRSRSTAERPRSNTPFTGVEARAVLFEHLWLEYGYALVIRGLVARHYSILT